ncbi:MAG: polysaccharide deacetylase [Methylocystis sp.]|jgi:hypothetical protein
MISLEECRNYAGLFLKEMVLGAKPNEKHHRLLAGYLFNMRFGAATVRELIVADIRVAMDLGAVQRAADLLLVLRMLLEEYPEARRENDPPPPERQPLPRRRAQRLRMSRVRTGIVPPHAAAKAPLF